MEPRPNSDKELSHLRHKECWRKRGEKIVRAGEVREFAVRLCCLGTSDTRHPYIDIVSPTRLLKREMNKDETNEHAKVDKKKPMGPQAYTKNHRHSGKDGSMRVSPPQR